MVLLFHGFDLLIDFFLQVLALLLDSLSHNEETEAAEFKLSEKLRNRDFIVLNELLIEKAVLFIILFDFAHDDFFCDLLGLALVHNFLR